MDTEKDKEIVIEQTNNMSNFNKKFEFTTLFEQDEDFIFVYKKTEKLTTAIYMVTNLFSDNESIKWTLRKKTTELLSFMMGYRDVFGSRQSDLFDQIKIKIVEIVSLLEISSYSGLISTMNFSIIKDEFGNLINTIKNLSTNHKESVASVLPKAFFDTLEKQVISTSNSTVSTGFQKEKQYLENVVSHMSDTSQKDKNLPQDIHIFTRTNRQNIILGLLKKKKELTIKDIALVIKNCSEKTIQRELVTLINLGVLKKVGERRWSKYSLV